MIRLETQYFKLNRTLLLAIGIWPYKQSNLTRFQFIFLSTILTSSLIFQCTPFISQKYTPDFVAKILSSASVFAVFVIKYNLFCVNIEVVKDLLEQLQLVYNELRDENEFAIINEYGYNAKRYTTVLTICTICGIFVLFAAQCWSSILNIILPLNISRPQSTPVIVEYFVDQKKYLFWIMLHIDLALLIGATAVVGIGTTLIAYLQYICGMFKIASYRIEHAMSNNKLRNMNPKNKLLIFEDLIWAVNIHQQAMKLSQHLQLSIKPMLFCLIICGVISMSLNLYRITSTNDKLLDNINDLIIPAISAFVTISYMFISNYIGQDITDHNHNVFVTVYNVRWYIAPLHIQRMILFLLQGRSKDFILTVGIFIASIECFATLIKASVSYFTFMYSTQG